jgi:glycosyltransferase involved in cell wall biosynthesis
LVYRALRRGAVEAVMPLFSVILITRDRRALLREAVGSVLAQTMPDFECVVVDDGSVEPPELPADPRIRINRRERSGGVSAARNAGLRSARGRYVTFMDDDDLMTDDRLQVGLDGLELAPIALCLRREIGKYSGRHDRGRPLDGRVEDVILDERIPHVGQVAVSREIAPAFDEDLSHAEDLDWFVRLAHLGEWATVPQIGYLCRHHPGPRQTGGHEGRLRSRLMILEKHSDYFRTHPRAAAYQWKRAGGIAARLGHHRLARRCYMRSIAARPSARTMVHLARSMRPSHPDRHEPGVNGKASAETPRADT